MVSRHRISEKAYIRKIDIKKIPDTTHNDKIDRPIELAYVDNL